MNWDQIKEKAQKEQEKVKEILNNEGVIRVLVAAQDRGLLRFNFHLKAKVGPVFVKDLLLACEVDERMTEILPALLIGGMNIVDPENYPQDLKNIVVLGHRPVEFRELNYLRWIGHDFKERTEQRAKENGK